MSEKEQMPSLMVKQLEILAFRSKATREKVFEEMKTEGYTDGEIAATRKHVNIMIDSQKHANQFVKDKAAKSKMDINDLRINMRDKGFTDRQVEIAVSESPKYSGWHRVYKRIDFPNDPVVDNVRFLISFYPTSEDHELDPRLYSYEEMIKFSASDISAWKKVYIGVPPMIDWEHYEKIQPDMPIKTEENYIDSCYTLIADYYENKGITPSEKVIKDKMLTHGYSIEITERAMERIKKAYPDKFKESTISHHQDEYVEIACKIIEEINANAIPICPPEKSYIINLLTVKGFDPNVIDKAIDMYENTKMANHRLEKCKRHAEHIIDNCKNEEIARHQLTLQGYSSEEAEKAVAYTVEERKNKFIQQHAGVVKKNYFEGEWIAVSEKEHIFPDPEDDFTYYIICSSIGHLHGPLVYSYFKQEALNQLDQLEEGENFWFMEITLPIPRVPENKYLQLGFTLVTSINDIPKEQEVQVICIAPEEIYYKPFIVTEKEVSPWIRIKEISDFPKNRKDKPRWKICVDGIPTDGYWSYSQMMNRYNNLRDISHCFCFSEEEQITYKRPSEYNKAN